MVRGKRPYVPKIRGKQFDHYITQNAYLYEDATNVPSAVCTAIEGNLAVRNVSRSASSAVVSESDIDFEMTHTRNSLKVGSVATASSSRLKILET